MAVKFGEQVIKAHVKVATSPATQLSTPEQLAVRQPKILVIGCGGTGGWVIPHLARLIKSLGVGSLTIADGDKVEPKNLTRQNFVASDVGEFKSIALAKRYSAAFGIPIRAISGMLEDVRGLQRQQPQVICGCVDQHNARRMIAEYMAQAYETAWIDCGNETVAGQVVLGYTGPTYRAGMRASGPIPVALPTISQMLDLPVAAEKRASCAEMVNVTEQVSQVNVFAANLAANFCRLILEDVKRVNLRQPVEGIEFSAVFFNCGNGGFATKYNTVENLAVAKKPLTPWRR